jgi:hypothetical protein
LARQMRHKARWGWLVAEASLPLPRLPWQLVLWGNYCIDIFTQEVEHKVDRYTSPMFFLMVAPPPFSTNWLSQASWRSSPVTLAATAFEASQATTLCKLCLLGFGLDPLEVCMTWQLTHGPSNQFPSMVPQ